MELRHLRDASKAAVMRMSDPWAIVPVTARLDPCGSPTRTQRTAQLSPTGKDGRDGGEQLPWGGSEILGSDFPGSSWNS